MDSGNTIAPTGRVVVRSGQGELRLQLPPTQGRHYSQEGTLAPDSFDAAESRVPAAWMFTPITTQSVFSVVKRTMDVAGGVLGLVATSPLWLLAALAVKCDGQGAVLFRQVRVGKHGRTFKMLKFRTMCVDAEHRKAGLAARNEMTGPVFKMQNDPRVTRLGRLLRKYSVDELPQLVNVVKGEMSLVGPRPALPTEVNQYESWQHQRLAVKPGLTCLWQVNGRNEVDFEEWMQLDLEYIRRSSLALDVKILCKTVPAVLRGTGV